MLTTYLNVSRKLQLLFLWCELAATHLDSDILTLIFVKHKNNKLKIQTPNVSKIPKLFFQNQYSFVMMRLVDKHKSNIFVNIAGRR